MNKERISWSFIVCLLMSSISGNSFAQTELDPDLKPVSETEIVCFAALKKWVCAPKDEQQKAHEKAMRLAEDKANNDLNLSNQVEIKTIKTNPDFSQQVQELPVEGLTQQDVVNQQLNDFIPRPAEPSTTDSDKKNADEFTDINSIEVVTTIEKETSSQSTASPASINATNNFKNWKDNHSSHWSFQVVGTSNQHHLNQFIADNGLQGLTHATVKTQLNGADWWIILVGLYDSRDQALNQRDQLPNQLADQAWVRQINTIEGE